MKTLCLEFGREDEILRKISEVLCWRLASAGQRLHSAELQSGDSCESLASFQIYFDSYIFSTKNLGFEFNFE